MRKNSSEFVTAFISEAGTFRINKDYFAFVELDDIACYIAADGIDSDEEINSAELVANRIFELFMKKPAMSRRKLKSYVVSAHKLLIEESRSVRLKSSLIVLVTDYSKMIWIGAGNTRLYHFRKGGFNFKSKDQSIAQMMADAGKITDDQINDHDERNNLTNYVGHVRRFKPFVSRVFKLNEGDVIFLCTSGFWENISTIDMVTALKDAKEPVEAIETLEDEFLSRQNNVVNNYTAAAVFVNKVFKENPKDNKVLSIVKKAAVVLIPIILIFAVIFIYRGVAAVKAKDLIVKCEESGDKYTKDGVFEKALEKYEEALDNLKKAKDKERQERIDKKCRIATLIVEGDKFFQNKEFDNAKDYYINARSQVEFGLQHDKAELGNRIDDKITKTNSYIDVLSISKEGDAEVAKAKDAESSSGGAKEYYSQALDYFAKAKDLAENIAFYDLKKEMEDKIKQTEEKIRQIKDEDTAKAEQDKKIQELTDKAEKFEKEGDRQFKLKKYDDAVYNYDCASEIYNDLKKEYKQDTEDKIFKMKKNLADTEKMIAAQKEEEKKKEAQKNDKKGTEVIDKTLIY